MDTPFDPTLEEDIRQLLAEVPAPVRACFASGKVETVAKNLMQKNQLHIDQGAVVEREIIMLLLGLKDPTEFTQSLAEEARLDKQTIDGIAQDVNEQIFIPLRDEMRKGGKEMTAPAKPAEIVRPMTAAVQTSAPPRVNIPSSVSLPPKLVMPRPAEASGGGGPHPTDNRKLLEDHEEPHIEFNKPPVPQNLPGTHIPIPARIPPQSVPTKTPPPPAKPYSTDPYRESIDEK